MPRVRRSRDRSDSPGRLENLQYDRQPKLTLAELLLIGLMLATLAAVVVPEFSNARAMARASDLDRTVQMLRGQIGKYRIEHHNLLPGDVHDAFDAAIFWKQLTSQTDDRGNAYKPAVSKSGPLGPYLQQVPDNDIYSAGGDVPAVRDGITDPPTPSPGTRFYFNFSDRTGKLWPAVDAQGTPGR